MHWLPLVAMVIASALPFPHNPVSRIAAATTEPGSDRHGEQHHDPAARLVDYNSPGNASQRDYNNHNNHNDMAATSSRHPDRQNLQDYVKSSSDEEPTENWENYPSQSNSGSERPDLHADTGSIRIEDPEEKPQPKDYRSESSSSRQDYSSLVEFPKKDNLQERLSQVPTAGDHNVKGLKGLQPTVPSEKLKEEPTVRTGSQGTTGATEEMLTQEAGLGVGAGLDGVLEGDEMFLDAHPRVLFSPSLWPPEHPPHLLMLETGLLEEAEEVEDGDREDREDVDGRIEGHGDWATERSKTRTWAPSSSKSTITEAAQPLRRDKRSHLNDRRRGEKSVCESESVWVTNKTSAIDNYGQVVTILQKIQTQAGTLRQYFYETRCRQAEQQSAAGRSRPAAAGAGGGGGGVGAGKTPLTGVAGAGCLGVDKKQWLSECKAKQSFVRALTKDANNRTGWRWIRIDSSCVCVLLSRTNQAVAREVLTRKGRG